MFLNSNSTPTRDASMDGHAGQTAPLDMAAKLTTMIDQALDAATRFAEWLRELDSSSCPTATVVAPLAMEPATVQVAYEVLHELDQSRAGRLLLKGHLTLRLLVEEANVETHQGERKRSLSEMLAGRGDAYAGVEWQYGLVCDLTDLYLRRPRGGRPVEALEKVNE